MNVLDLYRETHLNPRHVAGTNGGEWAGPCPKCGDGGHPDTSDRFRIWPEQNEGNGSFWCRRCEKGGDGITFLIEYQGMKYPQACEYLGKAITPRQVARTPRPPQEKQDTFFPETKDGTPAELWAKNATALVDWATEKLMGNSRPLVWLKERGITKDTARRFRLGWNPGTKGGEDLFRPRESWGLETVLKPDGKKKCLWIPRGLLIPHVRDGHVVRVRIRRPSEDPPRYYVMPGSQMDMMVTPSRSESKTLAMIVVESELDAILLDQEAGDLAGVVALGSASAKPDTIAFEILQKCECILVALDFDEAGSKAMEWWSTHFRQSERHPVPFGKDPAEAYKQGVPLSDWVRSGLPSGWQLGPSFGQKKQKEGKGQKREVAPQNTGTVEHHTGDTPNGKAVPPAVIELAEIMREHPVSVRVTKERMTLLESRSWSRKHWEVSRRFSELVYFNDEVFEYLQGLGVDVVNGKNIVRS
jgi:DNA primase